MQHKGPISKFSLHIPSRIDHDPDITQWLMFLSMNCINELYIDNWKLKSILKLPNQLFSCDQLTKLTLDLCMLNPPPLFSGFQKLIFIHLNNVSYPSNEAFRRFVASCPVLEELSIHDDYVSHQLPCLVINAPKLKYLSISRTFQSVCLNGSESLLSVSIFLAKLVQNPNKTKTQELIQFLASACKLEYLCFTRYFIKMLVAGGVSTILPVTTFTHVTNLRLTALHSWKELSCVVAIIRSCPNVQKLHISVNISETSSDVAENSLMSCNLPDKIFATPLH
ncbi:F-box/FBD/LRR-repeat protein At1g13570 isoform X1 [Spinacia oleracea]|uniref:F-box/FBD/LRR-repeat protein At1g13570 isoform X1 n=1 Tax=Spinacia oleracea TaxID=3562 RepID=A0A9R0JMI2_SPIOL|nr:F-box/FBD/LRR-repeat protein At1g13570-like isoform X1 [Spinacia oleracea]